MRCFSGLRWPGAAFLAALRGLRFSAGVETGAAPNAAGFATRVPSAAAREFFMSDSSFLLDRFVNRFMYPVKQKYHPCPQKSMLLAGKICVLQRFWRFVQSEAGHVVKFAPVKCRENSELFHEIYLQSS